MSTYLEGLREASHFVSYALGVATVVLIVGLTFLASAAITEALRPLAFRLYARAYARVNARRLRRHATRAGTSGAS